MKIEPASRLSEEPLFAALDAGEQAALTLGLHLNADLILMNERKGIRAARQKGLHTLGTIGLLNLAAEQKLLDLSDAFMRLRRTKFYCPEDLMEKLLLRHKS